MPGQVCTMRAFTIGSYMVNLFKPLLLRTGRWLPSDRDYLYPYSCLVNSSLC